MLIINQFHIVIESSFCYNLYRRLVDICRFDAHIIASKLILSI